MSDEAEVWDYLQPRFGFGNWDETTTDVPWWKFRANGIGQLKAMLRKRRVKPHELIVAAEYAIAHHKPVIELWQLFALVGEANAWQRQQQRAAQDARWADVVEQAIEDAYDAGETEWAERLMRASKTEAQNVINQWRNRE